MAAGQDFYLHRLLTQAVDLLHALLDITQVKDFALQAREGHFQHPIVLLFQLNFLQLAFQHQ
ncbi:hypothetical protein D3C80_1808350 [compost metagenome]